MDHEKLQRFRKRQRINESFKENSNPLYLVPKESLVQRYLTSDTDNQLFEEMQAMQESHYSIELTVTVADDEVAELLNNIHRQFDDEKFDLLIGSCKETVLDSITRPFGIAKLLFADRDGGNVTTVHNAKQGIYARKADEYDDSKYSYSTKNYLARKQNSDGSYTDEYTGQRINNPSVDHVISRNEFHKNGGFMVSDERKKTFANDERNFAITNQSLNSSKNNQDLKEFQDKVAGGREVDNKEHFGVDGRRANPAQKRAEQAFQEHSPSTKDKAVYYTGRLATTGASEGLKMGIQQALGLCLREFAITVFDEIKDIYRQGFKGGQVDDSFFAVLKERLTRIAKKLVSQWEKVYTGFKEGFISGFLSNLITTIINMFKTTVAKNVRMLREGFLSLLKALKIMLFRPAGLTRKQAAHEASKLIASGVIVAGGIALEEALTAMFTPVGGLVAPVLTGIVTGLATVLVVYMLDKIDLFGVNEADKHTFVVGKLNDMLAFSVKEAEEAMKIFAGPQLLGE